MFSSDGILFSFRLLRSRIFTLDVTFIPRIVMYLLGFGFGGFENV